MKRKPDLDCAAICGLFCGACPAYPNECHGCRSDYLRESCRLCHHGFRTCIKEKNINLCEECNEFPCRRSLEFSKGPIIEGTNNHKHVIRDLQIRKEIGTERWLELQMERFLDHETGELKTWYEMEEFKADNVGRERQK